MGDMERIAEIVAELAPELRKLTLDIHDNPEVGGQEYKALAWQVELLNKYGFETESNYCDIPTSYKAVYKGAKKGPKIAMLAEYDALKKLGHGCGHNLIAMISVGSGIAMREFADKYGAEIHVIGTPAEETDGAKVKMADKGAFKGYDAVMMAHPAYQFTDSINTSAIVALEVEFFGKASHAAESPEDGLNALDAVINMFNLVNALRQQTKDGTRIHGIIKNGGVEPNTIPEYTSAEFYVRAPRMKEARELLERVIKCAEGAALATGTTVKTVEQEGAFKDTRSNQTLSKLACRHMEELGADIVYTNGEVLAGSSDLGNVSYECPAIQLSVKLGDAPEGVSPRSAHTEDFAKKAASDLAIENGLMYVKGFTATAIDLMTKPELLAEIKREYDSEIGGNC